jgi:hypothetical protein
MYLQVHRLTPVTPCRHSILHRYKEANSLTPRPSFSRELHTPFPTFHPTNRPSPELSTGYPTTVHAVPGSWQTDHQTRYANLFTLGLGCDVACAWRVSQDLRCFPSTSSRGAWDAEQLCSQTRCTMEPMTAAAKPRKGIAEWRVCCKIEVWMKNETSG